MRTLTTILFFLTLTSYGQEGNPIKLGLGIVAIKDTYDESKVVTVYKDKDLKNKIEDFKLYGQLKNIWPHFFKPDYGLCYFVCLEKTKDYFKILINDKEEGFLRNDKDKYFKTWESLLINASVERLDVKTNPLKNNPSDNAETITLQNQITVDRLQVFDVIEINGEHWINVNYSKSGKVSCDKGTADCGEGWIKWKAGDKLLVNILLLC
jgi:mRNA-degrading endonuclease YafQ of YafQ-DinJ toxin-antitoxin module